jgi:hypothetical protein
MAKKTVSVKVFLEDVRAGFTDKDLMNKHGLSSRGLQSLFGKMTKAGIIKQAELDVRKQGKEASDQPGKQIDKSASLIDSNEAEALSRAEFEKREGALPTKEQIREGHTLTNQLPNGDLLWDKTTGLLVIGAFLIIFQAWATGSESVGKNLTHLAISLLLAILSVAVALAQPRVLPTYFRGILIALITGVIQDLSNFLPDQYWLISDWATSAVNILFAVAFIRLTELSKWLDRKVLLIVGFGAAIVWLLLLPWDVCFVSVVLFLTALFLVIGAWAVFRNRQVNRNGSWLILSASVATCLATVFYLRYDYVAVSGHLNLIISNALYSIGRIVLAFSVGKVKQL